MGFKHSEEELKKHISSHTPLIYVKTEEEKALLDSVVKVGNGLSIFSWSRGGGLKLIQGDKLQIVDDLYDPLKILAVIKAFDSDAVFILNDFHIWLEESKDYILHVKETANHLYEQQMVDNLNKHLIISSPIRKIPIELQKLCAFVEYSLPDYHDIEEALESFISKHKLEINDSDKPKIINSTLGLTKIEVLSSFKKSLAVKDTIDPEFLVLEKQHVIQKDGLLKYVKSNVKMEDVGGLKNLISWIEKRSIIFDDNVREKYNISNPKGILITGVPGTGKSYSAKMIASYLQMPLIGLDIGSLMSMWVGESEENLAKAISIVEMVSPCVLWIDEFDKAIPNLSNNQSHETTKRMMSTLLTWLQEKKEKVFVIATANNIHNLPPEIMRKGRFDEIFFVDLPDENERKEILEIHLKRKGLDITSFDLDALAQKTDGFSGSELESAINEGCVLAAFDGKEVLSEHIIKEIEQTNPLSKTMELDIKAVQLWAEEFKIRRAN